MASALELATLFHDTYERLAPSFGYETRKDTRAFDPNSANGRLMQAVCGEIASALAAHPEQAEPVTGDLKAIGYVKRDIEGRVRAFWTIEQVAATPAQIVADAEAEPVLLKSDVVAAIRAEAALQAEGAGEVVLADLNDDATAVQLWAEIHRLRAAVKGPDGFETWQDAAVSERVRRVKAERALAAAAAAAAPHRPTDTQAAGRDATRLDWLETKVVNVRDPLLHGSRDMFWTSPDQDDPAFPAGPSDIRKKIDAAIAATKGEAS